MNPHLFPSLVRVRLGLGLVLLGLGLLAPAGRAETNTSQILESVGQVEWMRAGQNNWNAASNGLSLRIGDRLRTGPRSRAALQFSDRSVVRLNERTLLEIQPPTQPDKRRFRLPGGSLFFFNRERPTRVEFETPLASGAIRGTEFFLEAAPNETSLALFDGLVDLRTPQETVALGSGEQVRVSPGQPARKTPLLETTRLIQWALYYPAVMYPEDLGLTATERVTAGPALEKYLAGDLQGARELLPAAESPGLALLQAAFALSLGRVEDAQARLRPESTQHPVARALNVLIQTVLSTNRVAATSPAPEATVSELLAESYRLQGEARLEAARAAARRAVAKAPQFGFALARLAELEFSFENRSAALAALEKAVVQSPRHAPARALGGFIRLEQGRHAEALTELEAALALDAGYGQAWLGRGLALLRLRREEEGLRSLQAAAALEPQRSLFRSYLGKAFSEAGETRLAEKEFRLARQLDAQDPTGWYYSALHAWREHRLNEAVENLERSAELNDRQSLFRSRLPLDRDQAVRSANLAALYADVGLEEVAQHRAARAVSEDYANFSGHLFLANSYQAREDRQRFNLRLETVRQSELLLANLLAPVGAGNLSQLLSQQDHLRFFEPRPFSVSSLTEYRSDGEWLQAGSVFGTVGGLSYAVDSLYESREGDRPNAGFEQLTLSAQIKQRITQADSLYLQVGRTESSSGDVASHYAPGQAVRGFGVDELQEPFLYLGWQHEWSPQSRTLLLFSRLQDRLDLTNPQPNVLFHRQSPGFSSIDYAPDFHLAARSFYTLYSGELQHLWQGPRHTLVVGSRYQHGEVESRADLDRAPFSGTVSRQRLDDSLERANAYAYGTWKITEELRLLAGLSYDHLSFPENTDLPPLSSRESSRDLLAPKLGLEFAPWERGLFRAAYTRSLGGLFFDQSVRLEPTQVGGFNQAYRSLLPESRSGLVPGTEFQTLSVGFDQSLPTRTYFGLESEWLSSDGRRTVGTLTNRLPFIPTPDAPSSTRQTLDFEERSISAYLSQLLGESFSVGARYRISEAALESRFPRLSPGTVGLDRLEQNERAVLQQLALTARFHHRTGLFAEWESIWLQQDNHGYAPGLAGENLWQHNFHVGYRFPRRQAELRAGLLNLTDEDYRLNPLNALNAPPPERTFVLSLRWNF